MLAKDLGLDRGVVGNFTILVPGFLRIDRDWTALINAYKELAKEYNIVLAIVGHPRLASIYESIEIEMGLAKVSNIILKPMFVPREELLK